MYLTWLLWTVAGVTEKVYYSGGGRLYTRPAVTWEGNQVAGTATLKWGGSVTGHLDLAVTGHVTGVMKEPIRTRTGVSAIYSSPGFSW